MYKQREKEALTVSASPMTATEGSLISIASLAISMEHLEFISKSFVWGDRELIARIGHPSSSVAYNTRDPKGDPLYLWEMVESIAVELQSARVRASSKLVNLAASFWWTSIWCQNSVSSASSSNCSPAAIVCEGLPVDDAIEISDRDINLLLLLLLSNPDDTTTDPEKEQEQFPNLLLHTSSLHTKLLEANKTGSSDDDDDDDDDDAEEIGGGGWGEAPRLLVLLVVHKSCTKAPDSSAVLEGKEEGILANAHIATGILIRGSRGIALALDIYTPKYFPLQLRRRDQSPCT
jgi:hypothetical protein